MAANTGTRKSRKTTGAVKKEIESVNQFAVDAMNKPAEKDKEIKTSSESVAPIITRKKPNRSSHDPEERILCRSVTQGSLLYPAKKSGITYIWDEYGDEAEVEYQDLLPLYLTKSPYLMNPWFIIEDMELVEEWSDRLGPLYSNIYQYEDIDYVLSLPTEDFRTAVLTMPTGLRDGLKTKIATKIDEGSFDSLQKIKIVDQILGTDLRILIE